MVGAATLKINHLKIITLGDFFLGFLRLKGGGKIISLIFLVHEKY